MMTTPVAAVAARGPNARSTRPLSPPGMNSVQLSRSRRRIASPMSVAEKTIQAPPGPAVSLSSLPAKNAAKASSGSASAAARDVEVNARIALVAKTIGTSRLSGWALLVRDSTQSLAGHPRSVTALTDGNLYEFLMRA
jgi:hypothetical protein